MKLVPFEERHYPTLINWITTPELNYQWGGPNYAFPLTLEQIQTHCLKSDIHPYLLCVDDKSVGFVELREVAPGSIRFCRVFISNQYHGQGLAKKMLTLAMDKAVTELSCKVLSLSVFRHNQVALNLYRSLGFTEINSNRADEFKFNKRWVSVEMERVLNG